MVTEMITLKLDDGFLKDVDDVVKKEGYQNRTEFIRNALREQVDKARLKEALIELAPLKGKSKKSVSDLDYEKARARAFEELERQS
ncbi:MAG TPA: ribbon-helix-helix domain-containing protein [Candidatus Nanoarchaeia archaeon]|nr:ribbon-helix-helix domain-containing protein [Candidatus Nanoarchaeia archaeon]